jgi:fructose-bisphosphate aldolase, class II
MEAMGEVCRQRFEQFGTAGNAPRIKILPMSAMAKRYASGSLDPALNLRRTAAE